jgi:hypothetical protein
MNQKYTNPSANVPAYDPDEPRGDRSEGDRIWTPDQGERSISNSPDDQAAGELDDDDEFDEDEDADEEEDEVDEDADEQDA